MSSFRIGNQKGEALPWTVGDGGWVAEDEDSSAQQGSEPSVKPAAPAALWHQVMSQEGTSPKLKVLYVPDYISREQRVLATSKLYVLLSQLLPGYEIELALAEGPFEDDDGISAHFENDALGAPPRRPQGPKQIAALKVDLHVSVVELARHAAMHKPRLVIGKGQGGVVALAYGHPGALEQVMATRNVQPAELPELSQAWGNVAAIVLQEPRLSKKGVQFSNIRAACPEMFANYPVASRRTFSSQSHEC